MKLAVRSGLYKSTNVTFNPKTCEAHSYAWWSFVKRIKGKVVFNSYRYSVTTAKHQRKVAQLLEDLGIKIDRTVQVRGGLQNIDSLKELNSAENATLVELECHQQELRERRNKRASERRAAKHAAAAVVQTPKLALVVTAGA